MAIVERLSLLSSIYSIGCYWVLSWGDSGLPGLDLSRTVSDSD